MSCLFSASKLEETVRKSRELLPLVLPLLPKYSAVVFNDVDDPVLLDYRNKMLLFERDILLASSFRFDFVHPHRLMLKLCKRLHVPRLMAYKCWLLLKKSYVWPHCVCFSNADLACACLFLACHLDRSILETSKNGLLQSTADLMSTRINGAHWTRYFGSDIDRVIALARNIALTFADMEPNNTHVKEVLIELNSLVSQQIQKRSDEAKAAKERDEMEAKRKLSAAASSGQQSRKTSDAWDRRVKRFESMGSAKSQTEVSSNRHDREQRRDDRPRQQQYRNSFREPSRDRHEPFGGRRGEDNRSFRDDRDRRFRNQDRNVRDQDDRRDQRFRNQDRDVRDDGDRRDQRLRNEDRDRQYRESRPRSREDGRWRQNSRELDRDRRRPPSRSRSRERVRDGDREPDGHFRHREQHRKRNYEDFRRADQPRNGNRRDERDLRDIISSSRRRSRSRSPRRN